MPGGTNGQTSSGAMRHSFPTRTAGSSRRSIIFRTGLAVHTEQVGDLGDRQHRGPSPEARELSAVAARAHHRPARVRPPPAVPIYSTLCIRGLDGARTRDGPIGRAASPSLRGGRGRELSGAPPARRGASARAGGRRDARQRVSHCRGPNSWRGFGGDPGTRSTRRCCGCSPATSIWPTLTTSSAAGSSTPASGCLTSRALRRGAALGSC
jgi:hypothetical protein